MRLDYILNSGIEIGNAIFVSRYSRNINNDEVTEIEGFYNGYHKADIGDQNGVLYIKFKNGETLVCPTEEIREFAFRDLSKNAQGT